MVSREVSATLRLGKTVTIRLRVDVDSCRVEEARVTGDFFVYPPEVLEEFEARLRGCRGPSCFEEAARVLGGAAIVGFTVESLLEALEALYGKACGESGGRVQGGGAA